MSSPIPVSAGHTADTGPTLAAVKALQPAGDRVLGTAHAPLVVSRSRPGWSEQEPEDWWTATCACLDALGAARLAKAALTGRSDFPRQRASRVFEPRPALVQRHDEASAGWSQLYSLVRRLPGCPSPAFSVSDSLS